MKSRLLPPLNPTMISRASGMVVYATLAFLIAHTNFANAEVPLHVRIDDAVGFGKPDFDSIVANPAGDATFARRIYLDLTGAIPSAQQLRTFLADDSADKRATLVDELLASPQYARRMQYVFDTMLMERRPDKHVKADEWREYLRVSFAENKPWDQLVSEMLSSDGAESTTRPPAKFLLDRELKIDDVTRDVGRMFLGRDLQCAQCHDHPHIDEYLQRHYYGIAAFLNRTYVFKDPKTKLASIGEKAVGAVKFTSVFTDESGETPPRMLDLPPIQDPPTEKNPYKVKPTKKDRSVPIYSRRLKLAAAVTNPANAAFRENIANRLWALMIGRGIVEPVDMLHVDNPPSNPKLLALLAEAFQKKKYDIRYLLREIALSKTYQLSSEYLGDDPSAAEKKFAVATLKPLTPEQLASSMMQATSLTDATLATLQEKHLKSDAENDPDDILDPQWQEAAVHDALKSHVSSFVSFFGVRGIQTSQFDASANQALFLRNGSLVHGWLKPSGNLLAARLAALDPPDRIDEFYLALFSRHPTDDEIDDLTAFFADSDDNSPAAIGQLIWAALSSAEFRFNH